MLTKIHGGGEEIESEALKTKREKQELNNLKVEIPQEAFIVIKNK